MVGLDWNKGKASKIEQSVSHKPTILFDTSSIVSIDCDDLEEDDMKDLQRKLSLILFRSAPYGSFSRKRRAKAHAVYWWRR